VARKERWSELSPSTRKLIVAGAAFDATLKIAALVDLVRRPAAEVRGSKMKWAGAIVVVNSGGVLPIVYFVRGRQVDRRQRLGSK
jgi:hypothetical protein